MSSCAVGPDYKKVEFDVPEKFKHAGTNWKIIDPSDDKNKGEWWKIYNDAKLSELVLQMTKNNHSLKSAESKYLQAQYLADKARVSFLPDIKGTSSATTQHQRGGNVSKSHTSSLSASWEPDLWGNISRTLESKTALSGVAKAQLASARLSNQALLVQNYYQYLMAIKDQEILDKIVSANIAIAQYRKNRMLHGVDSMQNLVQAEQQLENAKSESSNNRFNIVTYQNAISVLVGEVPSNFSLELPKNIDYPNISIPITVPSAILERRPDIAEAERNVANASAEIGITRSAFFPILSLSKTLTYSASGVSNLLNLPLTAWTKIASLTVDVTQLASYNSANKAAKENYNSYLETYKNTVLAAFQDVEDNMATLKSYEEQTIFNKKSCESAKTNLEISKNQSRAGTIDRSALSEAEITYYNALKTLNYSKAKKILYSTLLIKSLGGGWEEE